jgi:hypothetical protein
VLTRDGQLLSRGSRNRQTKTIYLDNGAKVVGSTINGRSALVLDNETADEVLSVGLVGYDAWSKDISEGGKAVLVKG